MTNSLYDAISNANAQSLGHGEHSDARGPQIDRRRNQELYVHCGHCGAYLDYDKLRPRALRWRVLVHAVGGEFVESLHATSAQCMSAVRREAARHALPQ